MICKHVQDPIKAWRRKKQKEHAGTEIMKPVVVIEGPTAVAAVQGSDSETITHQTETSLRRDSLQLFHQLQKQITEPESETDGVVTIQQTESHFRRDSQQLFQQTQKEVHSPANGNRCIAIFFCSAGTIAEKLANKLHRWLKSLVKDSSGLRLCSRSKPLNSLSASDLAAENILLLIVSSTGQGEIPSNGLGFPKLCENISSRRLRDRTQGFRFAVFGNGDSRYSTTYNGAAVKINGHLTQVGGCPLIAGVFQADTAVEPLPLSALKIWYNKLQPSIVDQPIESLAMAVGKSPTGGKHETTFVRVTPIVQLGHKYEDYQDRLLSTLGKASLVDASPGMHEDGSLLMTLDVDDDHFEEMSCIQVLPLNAPSKVTQALQWLCVKGTDRVSLGLDGRNPTYASFLTDYVDLELPFSNAECLEAVESASHGGLIRASLSKLSIRNVLERLHSSIVQMSDGQRCGFIEDMCQDMPLLQTRTYSIASSKHYHPSSCNPPSGSSGQEVDIMVKVLPGGRFSETFVKDSSIPASLRYRIVDSPSGATLRKNHLKPFVVVATGAGFGPVRSLLQWRIAILRDHHARKQQQHPSPSPSSPSSPSSPYYRRTGSSSSRISLFLGLKPPDVDLISDILNEAMALDLVDLLHIVLSNPSRRRVYDDLPRYADRLRAKLLEGVRGGGGGGVVFVCTNRAAAQCTRGVLEEVLGGSKGKVAEVLGERYVEEVY